MNKFIVGMLLALVCITGYASDCDHLYPNSKVVETTTSGEICKSFFVVVYDAKFHHPLFSSQYFQPHDKSMTKRKGSFYNNVLNDIDTRNYPEGYDRGHLTPAADAINPIQMHDTFDIMNSAPQVPSFNRGEWKELEESIRKDVKVPTWIVTGLIWGEDKRVPISFYKVIIMKPISIHGFNGIPHLAYVGDNSEGGQVRTINIHQLEETIGYKLIIE